MPFLAPLQNSLSVIWFFSGSVDRYRDQYDILVIGLVGIAFASCERSCYFKCSAMKSRNAMMRDDSAVLR